MNPGSHLHDAERLLDETDWRGRAARHRDAVDQLTCDHRRRTASGATHPVEDFLFTYYSLRPAQLRRWHPGARFALRNAPERAGWRFHRIVGGTDPAPHIAVDVNAFVTDRGDALRFVTRLLSATRSAPAQFGCFGLHEWAMVYRQDETSRRHATWPLRLGARGTDEVVRTHQIRCTHYDAVRFFTAPAVPRNTFRPDPASRERLEQPGCLHASMDLYKWTYKLVPLVSSDLLLRTFLLAREIRALDMRASPYDLTALGYPPVPIETAEGKAEYVAEQRIFAVRAQALRSELLREIDAAAGVPSEIDGAAEVPRQIDAAAPAPGQSL